MNKKKKALFYAKRLTGYRQFRFGIRGLLTIELHGYWNGIGASILPRIRKPIKNGYKIIKPLVGVVRKHYEYALQHSKDLLVECIRLRRFYTKLSK